MGERAAKLLFVDARHIYRQVDRAHRDWTEAQVGFLANIVRLYRGEAPDFTFGGPEAQSKLHELFGQEPKYADVAGLCKSAPLSEIETHDWSLNPGRFVGVAPGEELGDEDFQEKLLALNEEFETLSMQARDSMIIDDMGQRAGNSGSKFQNGDTLFARITPCLENGKTAFVQFLPDARSVAFGSTEFIVLRSKTLTPEFVYLLSRTDEFRGTAIKSMSGASGRQRVQERCFDTMSVVQPPAEVLARFTEVVRPMFRLVHQLHLQNLNLRATRDLLLPRLLSGQLSLTKVEGDPAVLEQPVAAARMTTVSP